MLSAKRREEPQNGSERHQDVDRRRSRSGDERSARMTEGSSGHHGKRHGADRPNGQRMQRRGLRQQRHEAGEGKEKQPKRKPAVAEVKNPKQRLVQSCLSPPARQAHADRKATSKLDPGRSQRFGRDQPDHQGERDHCQDRTVDRTERCRRGNLGSSHSSSAHHSNSPIQLRVVVRKLACWIDSASDRARRKASDIQRNQNPRRRSLRWAAYCVGVNYTVAAQHGVGIFLAVRAALGLMQVTTHREEQNRLQQ